MSMWRPRYRQGFELAPTEMQPTPVLQPPAQPTASPPGPMAPAGTHTPPPSTQPQTQPLSDRVFGPTDTQVFPRANTPQGPGTTPVGPPLQTRPEDQLPPVQQPPAQPPNRIPDPGQPAPPHWNPPDPSRRWTGQDVQIFQQAMNPNSPYRQQANDHIGRLLGFPVDLSHLDPSGAQTYLTLMQQVAVGLLTPADFIRDVIDRNGARAGGPPIQEVPAPYNPGQVPNLPPVVTPPQPVITPGQNPSNQTYPQQPGKKTPVGGGKGGGIFTGR